MSLESFLELLDQPRQAVWNLAEGVGKFASGDGSFEDLLGAIPGALGGLAGGALAATGFGIPGAILGGSLVGGTAQAVPGAREAMRPGELLARMGMEEDSLPGIIGSLGLGIATDPLTWAIPGFGMGRGAAKGAESVTPYAGLARSSADDMGRASMVRPPGDYVPNYGGGDSRYEGLAKWSDEMADRNVEKGFARDADETALNFADMFEQKQRNSLLDELRSGGYPGGGARDQIPKSFGFEYDDWMRGYDPELAKINPLYGGLSAATRDLPRDGLSGLDLISQRADLTRGLDESSVGRYLSGLGVGRKQGVASAPVSRTLADEAARFQEALEVDRAAAIGRGIETPVGYNIEQLIQSVPDIAERSYQSSERIGGLIGPHADFAAGPIGAGEVEEVLKAIERAGFGRSSIDTGLIDGRALARMLHARGSMDGGHRLPWKSAASLAELPADLAKFAESPNALENLLAAIRGTGSGAGEISAITDGARGLGLEGYGDAIEQALREIEAANRASRGSSVLDQLMGEPHLRSAKTKSAFNF